MPTPYAPTFYDVTLMIIKILMMIAADVIVTFVERELMSALMREIVVAMMSAPRPLRRLLMLRS